MTTVGEIKITLQHVALQQGLTVTGLHSVVLTEGNIVDALFDVEPPDESGCGLHFQFPLPEIIPRRDLSLFCLWLVAPDGPVTIN